MPLLQFNALLVKNFKTRRRRWIQTGFEIIIPLVLIGWAVSHINEYLDYLERSKLEDERVQVSGLKAENSFTIGNADPTEFKPEMAG